MYGRALFIELAIEQIAEYEQLGPFTLFKSLKKTIQLFLLAGSRRPR